MKQGDIVIWTEHKDLGYFLVIERNTACRQAFAKAWPIGCAGDGQLDIIRLEDGQVYSPTANKLQVVQVVMVP